MTAYVALLRAVNVGGRQLKMGDLKSIADELGYKSPRTFIASGNLLFESGKNEAGVKGELERALSDHMGKTIEVMIRSAAEMSEAAKANPFPHEPGSRVAAIFVDDAPQHQVIAAAKNVADERLALGKREIYVHYPSGMGKSKLRLGGDARGTARNMNTVARLAELAKEMS